MISNKEIMSAKTIQIYLETGDPKGIKEASMTTLPLEIIQLPRVNLSDNKKCLDFLGVYVLVDSLRTEKPKIYIGKGNVMARVVQHDNKKDFWNLLFAIKLNDKDGFNEAHCKFFEYYFVDKAKKLKLSDVSENAQTPQKPTLSKSIVSDCEFYIDVIETLLSTLGLKCFQKQESEKLLQDDVFICKDSRGHTGEGTYTEEGFLVYKGAVCKKDLMKSVSIRFTLREELINSGVLKLKGDSFLLNENKVFSSPSQAAMIILGRCANGWIEWKTKDGKTLDELKRK